jgi:hypothetical protein
MTTTDAPSYKIQCPMIANVITMFIPKGKIPRIKLHRHGPADRSDCVV